ncbi:deoxyribonuclease IV, partial [Enterobacter hormaechei]
MRAAEIQGHAFALFKKNQRQSRGAPLTAAVIDDFKAPCEKYCNGPGQILHHDSYHNNVSYTQQTAQHNNKK